VGLKSFGIYAPIAITFAFYQLGNTDVGVDINQGLRYGFSLAIIIFIAATFAHELTKRTRLHYLPKMSLVLSIVTLAVLGFLVVAANFNRSSFIAVDPLPILLLITVSEQMISIYIKKGRKAAYMLITGTLLVSALIFILISWKQLQNVLLTHPYLSLVTLILNFIIGKWKGFRIKEYFRFKPITDPGESN
jgi:hypothetical protein